jgi:hypothetical protein
MNFVADFNGKRNVFTTTKFRNCLKSVDLALPIPCWAECWCGATDAWRHRVAITVTDTMELEAIIYLFIHLFIDERQKAVISPANNWSIEEFRWANLFSRALKCRERRCRTQSGWEGTQRIYTSKKRSLTQVDLWNELFQASKVILIWSK